MAEPIGGKFGIGDVVFAKNGKYEPIMGAQRIALLRMAYQRQDLGEYTMIVLNPQRKICWEDVNWKTAGIRVTENA